MLQALDFVLPSIILIRAIIRFAKTYKLFVDKGELYYKFKHEVSSFLVTFFLSIASIGFVYFVSARKIDINSLYIYDKYYTSVAQLFSSTYYSQLYKTLQDASGTDFEALQSLKATLSTLPFVFSIIASLLSDFSPSLLSAGIYANGIFDGANFYAYDAIESYTVDETEEKPAFNFTLKKKSWTNEDKLFTIHIAYEDVKDVESYLKHEIKSLTAFETSVSASSK